MRDIVRTRIRWLLIGWMFAISAIAYLDRVNISIAGKTMAGEYGFSDIELGWVFSAFVLGYALFQPVGGRLADRFGPRRIVALGTIWWSVFTSLTALVPTGVPALLATVIGVRFLLGVGEAVVYPASNRLVASWIPSKERGLANGIIFAGVGAGAGIAPPLIAYVMSQYGWRWSFWTSAMLGLAAGIVWYVIVRDTPAEHPRANDAERAYIAAGLPERSAADPHAHRALPWRAILRDRNVIAMTISYFTYGYAAYIFFTWFFIYLNDVRGLNLKTSSYYGMLPFIAMAIASPVGGIASDRLVKARGQRIGRTWIAAASMLAAAAFIALGVEVRDARFASLILAGGAGALYLSQSAFWTVTSDIGGTSAGSVSGVMNMGNQIGGTITASLSPLIAEHFGWTASFLSVAAVCVVGAIAWLAVDPTQPIRTTRVGSS